MSTTTRAYAALSAKAALGPFSLERRDPRPDDVAIEIQYCGVCHSDIHSAHDDWGGATYPLVPGHEIVGKVTAVGAAVTKFSVGDRVGVGCLVGSCRACAACGRSHEQYCAKPVFTYNSKDPRDGSMTYGGYAERIVVAQDFVLNMPEGLDLAKAAPLLCAGITTWSPLRHWKVGPGTRLGVVGLGGLGHMALKFGKALGADVTLFSRSPGKTEDARALGADRVVISTDAAQMAAVRGAFDVILDTVPNAHDLNPYIPALDVDGTLVLVGYLGPLELNSAPMILKRKAVVGSLIGGIAETQEMLEFCGAHGITSDIELIDIASINTAYERMMRSDVKYRFVIDLASLA